MVKALTAKEINRHKLIDYQVNPDNDFLNRESLSTLVLGYKQKNAIYKYFTPDELCDIEKEALDIRRTKYAYKLAITDKALFDKAKEGDVAAIRLVYQRFEGWVEKQKKELSGPNNGPIKHELSMNIKNKLKEICGE